MIMMTGRTRVCRGRWGSYDGYCWFALSSIMHCFLFCGNASIILFVVSCQITLTCRTKVLYYQPHSCTILGAQVANYKPSSRPREPRLYVPPQLTKNARLRYNIRDGADGFVGPCACYHHCTFPTSNSCRGGLSRVGVRYSQ